MFCQGGRRAGNQRTSQQREQLRPSESPALLQGGALQTQTPVPEPHPARTCTFSTQVEAWEKTLCALASRCYPRGHRHNCHNYNRCATKVQPRPLRCESTTTCVRSLASARRNARCSYALATAKGVVAARAPKVATVVGGEDEKGVVPEPSRLEPVHNRRELVVDRTHHPRQRLSRLVLDLAVDGEVVVRRFARVVYVVPCEVDEQWNLCSCVWAAGVARVRSR